MPNLNKKPIHPTSEMKNLMSLSLSTYFPYRDPPTNSPYPNRNTCNLEVASSQKYAADANRI